MDTKHVQFFSGINETQIDIWFSLDPVPPTGRFIIYFKLTPPNDFFFGDIIRDEHGKPYTFQTKEEALSFGQNYVLGTLIGEE